MIQLKSILSLIVAYTEKEHYIGIDNRLPWSHIPENSEDYQAIAQFKQDDMNHFKQRTKQKPVIMGYRTWLSIGKPLRNRFNIVLSRQWRQVHPDCKLHHSIEDALHQADQWNECHNPVEPEIMIIGGAEIYRQFMAYAQRMYITEINKWLEGDTRFPSYDHNDWNQKVIEQKNYGNLTATFFQLDKFPVNNYQ